MALADRVKNILLTPTTEWGVIEIESSPAASLIPSYVVPLAAIGAVAGLIGGSIVGQSLPFVGTYRVPLATGIGLAVFTFVMAIVGVFILSLIINALATSFGGTQNSEQALKVAVYSYTPAWVAAVLNILPALGLLGILAAIYGIYLMYLGLPRLMKAPADKAAGYTAVVVVCAIVLSVVIVSIGGMFSGAAMMRSGALGGGLFGGGGAAPTSEVQFDKDSALGKLEALGNKLEESGRKMEAAEKSGDADAQMNAAMEGIGALLGGGTRVDPVDIALLKPLVPETFAGLPRTSTSAEKTGFATLMISKAEATYGDGGQKRVTLEISDTGGMSGLMGLASWAGVQGEQEDAQGSERTHKVNGRLVHEKVSKTGGTNEFGMVIADRFLVNAEGRGVDLTTLKAAVSGLDLGTLESMKGSGVKP